MTVFRQLQFSTCMSLLASGQSRKAIPAPSELLAEPDTAKPLVCRTHGSDTLG